MARSAILAGAAGPIYVAESHDKSAILPGAYLAETAAGGGLGVDPFAGSALDMPPSASRARLHPAHLGFVQAGHELVFAGQGAFFGAPGMAPPQLSWPVPAGPVFPADNRGFFFVPTKFLGGSVPSPGPGGVVPGPVGYHPPFFLGPPPSVGLPPAWGTWALRLIDVVNGLLAGKQNTSQTVTLAANADSTTVIDARISAFSVILFMPLTATAATEHATGTMYVSDQTTGQATIAHANDPATDRRFRLIIVS